RSALGPRAAGAALVILAFDPALVHAAESARPYALAELFALVALAGLPRASVHGARSARAVAWSAAVLAVYAHPVFAPLVPALVLGALAAEGRGYARRALAQDALLALVALLPALAQMA